MTEIERNCLVEFFNSINEKFEYVVLRNANELPYENFSNDIDILVDENHFLEFEQKMNKILVSNGFERVERTSFHGIECYTFYNIKNEIHSLKIDLFFNVQGGGVKYYDFKDIIIYKEKTENDIFVLKNEIEYFLTALKTIAAGGKLKEKYLNNFLDSSIKETHTLYKNLKSKKLYSYLTEIKTSKKNPINIDRKSILKEVRANNWDESKITTILNNFNHIKNEILRSFTHNYKFVFVGPDGSGKTTLNEKLINESFIKTRAKKERFKVFHHRPHLLPMISEIFKKNKASDEVEDYDHINNPHSGKSSNIIVSIIKLMYYTFDYTFGFLFKILPLNRQGKFIIFDRYYYDFIVDQKRSAINIPKPIVKILYKLFIPKPTKVYFIKVDPITAHERKKELSVAAIEVINNEYTILTREFTNFKMIENNDLDKAYYELLEDFIISTSTKVKI
jgi:thymidylate kinase